jgi:hypothetical protein
VGAALSIYPLREPLSAFPKTVAQTWTHRFNHVETGPSAVIMQPTPFLRATPGLSNEPEIVPSGGPMHKFLADAAALRDLIGDRPTYVVDAGPYYTGLVYFMLDLKPAPFLFDKETMIINDVLYREHVEYFKAHIHEVKCLIGSRTPGEETRAFNAAYPHVVIHDTTLGAASLVVMLADSRQP